MFWPGIILAHEVTFCLLLAINLHQSVKSFSCIVHFLSNTSLKFSRRCQSMVQSCHKVPSTPRFWGASSCILQSIVVHLRLLSYRLVSAFYGIEFSFRWICRCVKCACQNVFLAKLTTSFQILWSVSFLQTDRYLQSLLNPSSPFTALLKESYFLHTPILLWPWPIRFQTIWLSYSLVGKYFQLVLRKYRISCLSQHPLSFHRILTVAEILTVIFWFRWFSIQSLLSRFSVTRTTYLL